VASLCTLIGSAGAGVAAAAATDAGPAVVAGWGQYYPLITGNRSHSGSPVPPVTQLPAGAEFAALAAGSDFAIALGSDGAVYTWGYNTAGQLGTAQNFTAGWTVPVSDPVRVALPGGTAAVEIAADDNHARSFAVGTDGAAYRWGEHDDCHPADSYTPEALPLPAGVRARHVAGSGGTTYVLGDDGNVYAAGNNAYQQLGTGSTAAFDCAPSPVALPAGVTATAIAAGGGFALAAGSDGQLYAWGTNLAWGSERNGPGHRSSPVQVGMPGGVAPTALAGGDLHALIVGSDGLLYAWGGNINGQLGDGTTADRAAAVPVAMPTGVTPTAIAASNRKSLAMGSDGRLYGWGRSSGDLAYASGTSQPTPTPFDIPEDARVRAIAAGFSATFAVADSLAPQFTQATPPTTATAGSSLDYTFTASALPAPTYALAAGAPSWLHIDRSSGKLTGTLPADASTFSFSVTATNLAGSTTAGPFTVTVPLHPVDVSGTVVQDGGVPVLGAVVDVCAANGSVCQHATTDVAGALSVTMTPDTTVVVTAYPRQGSGMGTGSTGALLVPTGGLSGVTLQLPALGSLGAGVSVSSGQVGTAPGGQPVLHWAQAATLRVDNCANGTGLMTLVGQNTATGQYEYHSYPLTEDPAGSGVYTGTIPPQYPIHGPVEIKQTVTCAGQSGVQPQSGLASGGETVMVSGPGVGGATAVHFGAAAATDLQSVSDDLLSVTAPAGTGTVPVMVALASGTATAGNYTYVDANDVPGLDQVGYQRATTAAAPAPTPQAQTDSAGAVPLDAMDTTGVASLLADSTSDSSTLAAIAKWVYNNFPGGEAATLRSAVASAMLALNPTCDSDRAALKAAAHLFVAAGVLALVTQLSPLLVLGAEAVLTALVDPIVAALLEPAVSWLVAKLVGVILNKLIDAMIDAAIDAVLGKCENRQTNALIDPSGTVLDTNGNPISGATVTILRSDSETGPFTAVDVSQPGIEPTTNPETTAADGVFHWDVRSGYYEVRAGNPGCTVPGHADQSTATIGPYPVPPPQVGLTITLQCPDEAAAPTPVVTALNTPTGPPGGGTDLIVSGSGFTPSASVTVGGTAASSATYVGPNAIEITTPAHAVGPADVVVHTAGGDSATSSADRFVYGTTPVVTGLSQTTGPTTGGTVVTVTGSGFTGATVVGFGGVPGSGLTVASDTQLTVTTPAATAAGPAEVEVVTPIGGNPAGPPAEFTYTEPPAPACSPVSATAPSGAATTVQLACTGEGIVYDPPGQPAHGTLSELDTASGTVTYTATAGFTGTDTFSYTAHNTGGTAEPATVTITVTAQASGRERQTVSFPAPTGMTYGDPDQPLTATTTAAGLRVSFSAGPARVCAVDHGQLHVAGAGTCIVKATQAGDARYAAAAPVTHRVGIAKAVLTVTAGDATMIAHGPVPAVEPSYAGFVNSETPAVLDTPPSCTARPGTRTTSCSGGADTDYRFTYRPGALSIQPATAPAGGGSPTRVTLSDRTVPAGGSETITGTGFAAGEHIRAMLHSTAIDLGTHTADGTGRVQLTITVPAGLLPGEHHITLTGQDSGRSATAPLTVGTPMLASTGLNLAAPLSGALLSLLLGCGLSLAAARRPRAAHIDP
jgi:alpha-tubulin suppressor-like RCC1 family protein